MMYDLTHHERTDLDRPLVVWDGECPVCLASVRLLYRLVGEAIETAPYQRAHREFARLSREEFSESVHLLEPDGRVYRGAEAVFRALDHADWRVLHLGRWLYEHVGVFARVSERIYEWVSRNRPMLSRMFRPLLPAT